MSRKTTRVPPRDAQTPKDKSVYQNVKERQGAPRVEIFPEDPSLTGSTGTEVKPGQVADPAPPPPTGSNAQTEKRPPPEAKKEN